jgi:DNA modification methylase
VATNQLYYGDNLDVLRQYIPDASVDLIYLDPPFNSNRGYNVIFARRDKVQDANTAQIQAFDDTWRWTAATEDQYTQFVSVAPGRTADAMSAFRTLLGENDAMAYLVNMGPRLQELHRVLKPSGSLYLHCDPTMSHYLKILLDSIFGARFFRGEITWERTTTHNDAKRWSPNADIILYYGKTDSVTWNAAYTEHDADYLSSKYRYQDADGRVYRLDNITSPNPRPNLTYEWLGHEPPPNGWRYSLAKMTELHEAGLIWYPDVKTKRPQLKRYLDEQKGNVVGNIWTDISPINSRAAERLGYPTQKPLTLLERIIRASSNEGDVVLDPFCGCGTTVDAAQRLNRKWIGMDVTYIAIDLISKRLRHTYGNGITDSFDVYGIPSDVASAQALFNHSPFDFERWAVSLINAEPNAKQVGDRGIDGIARFPLDTKRLGKVLVSVKGGKNVAPTFVRDLDGTVNAQNAEMGVLITMVEASRGVREAIDHGGTWTHPANGEVFPRLQHVTIAELLAGRVPKMPGTILPYITAPQARSVATPDGLF